MEFRIMTPAEIQACYEQELAKGTDQKKALKMALGVSYAIGFLYGHITPTAEVRPPMAMAISALFMNSTKQDVDKEAVDSALDSIERASK